MLMSLSPSLSFPSFPFCRGEAGNFSLCSTATFVIFSIAPHCWPFPHFSSSSAFLRSLFKQSSHLSCCRPRFLQPPCSFVSDLFGNLSSFILTIWPAHFIQLLTILPTMEALVPISSLRFFIPLLSILFTPAILLIYASLIVGSIM